MQNGSWFNCLRRMGWMVYRGPRRRVAKLRMGWGSETEQLENRALLSAANHGALLENQTAAELAPVSRKAQPVQFPNVQGTWNVTSTGKFNSTGTVTMTQNGSQVTSLISIDGLEPFTLVGKFKRHSPNEITKRSPRISVPDFPIDVRLKIQIHFPSGNLDPNSFSGTVKGPFGISVANLSATKAEDNV